MAKRRLPTMGRAKDWGDSVAYLPRPTFLRVMRNESQHVGNRLEGERLAGLAGTVAGSMGNAEMRNRIVLMLAESAYWSPSSAERVKVA